MRPQVLGILNLTPDSFSDGGVYAAGDAAMARAFEIAREGADILDAGGESTRPGSEEVPLDEELRRILPLLDAIAGELPIPISIDTRRATVAAAAAERGASILNDTSALRDDPEIAAVAAELRLRVVLMHRRGIPRTMQEAPRYDDLIGEVRAFLEERVEAALEAGIEESHLILDPGLGFGKRPADNFRLVANLEGLRVRSIPIAVGASRKSFLAAFDPRPPRERLPGSLAFAASAAAAGADLLRVHDVAETVCFLDTLCAIEDAREEEAGA